MGHSFGGAPAIRVGVGLDPLVTGVVTFATQSAGCEAAAGLHGKPLLLFHGERDEILPVEASEMVRMMAGSGELVRLPGDGHLLAKSGDVMWERLEAWLPEVLGIPCPRGDRPSVPCSGLHAANARVDGAARTGGVRPWRPRRCWRSPRRGRRRTRRRSAGR